MTMEMIIVTMITVMVAMMMIMIAAMVKVMTAEFDGCRECLCNQCVTTHRQAWLGNTVAPHNRNADLRKKRFNIFGKCLTEGRHGYIQCIYGEKHDLLTGKTIQWYTL